MFNLPLTNNYFTRYLIKFIGIFFLLYFGTKALIGLVSPGGYYIPFLDQYFNYISWLRASLLFALQLLFSFIGIEVYNKNIYTISIQNGSGLHIVYSCLGYGVMSFWAAFVLANDGKKFKKIGWLFLGLLVIWSINVLRLFIFMLSNNNHWQIPFGLDHHTLFTVFAYGGIFIMMYFFDRSVKQNIDKTLKHA